MVYLFHKQTILKKIGRTEICKLVYVLYQNKMFFLLNRNTLSHTKTGCTQLPEEGSLTQNLRNSFLEIEYQFVWRKSII